MQNTQIKKLELTVPSIENPFGKLELEVEIPLLLEANKEYPQPKENVDVVLSEKSVELLSQLKDSLVADLYATK